MVASPAELGAGFTSSVGALVRRRYSCRTYAETPIAPETRRALSAFLAADRPGPFGPGARFVLLAATGADRTELQGLGTYGFIRGATGFIAGAIEPGPKALEDYGYLLERAVLYATDLGLATCWLGGTFSKSSFAARIALTGNEMMPAVVSIGHAAEGSRADGARLRIGADSRLPNQALFFDSVFGQPISDGAGGSYAEALEAVRWAPSASNKQPWRVVRTEGGWHFFLERTRGYGRGSALFTMMGLADLQRVDLGIAMCHFELAAREECLDGKWVVTNPGLTLPDRTEYVATWRPREP